LTEGEPLSREEERSKITDYTKTILAIILLQS
jgi:hypothetical protein